MSGKSENPRSARDVIDLEERLNGETVYVNDEELIEAGYEIHEFQERWYSLGLQLFAASVTFVCLLVPLLVPPMLPDHSIFKLFSADVLFNLAASLLYGLALYGLSFCLGYRQQEKSSWTR